MKDEPVYSVWLLPEEKAANELDQLMAGLRKVYGSEPFAPHVTLYSGTLKDRERITDAILRVAEANDSLTLEASAVAAGEPFFKSVFVEFEHCGAIFDLHEQVKHALGEDSVYRLIPHLSLLYLNLPVDKKMVIAGEVRLPRRSIVFDRIALVSPGNQQDGWLDVASWVEWFRWPIRRSLEEFQQD